MSMAERATMLSLDNAQHETTVRDADGRLEIPLRAESSSWANDKGHALNEDFHLRGFPGQPGRAAEHKKDDQATRDAEPTVRQKWKGNEDPGSATGKAHKLSMALP